MKEHNDDTTLVFVLLQVWIYNGMIASSPVNMADGAVVRKI